MASFFRASSSFFPGDRPTRRFILVGGFLGAGKTMLTGLLAQWLESRQLRTGLVTNDQARGRSGGSRADETLQAKERTLTLDGVIETLKSQRRNQVSVAEGAGGGDQSCALPGDVGSDVAERCGALGRSRRDRRSGFWRWLQATG